MYFKKEDKARAHEFVDRQTKAINIEVIDEGRTVQQNKALHVFFEQMSDQLNNLGIDYEKQIGGLLVSMPHTQTLFKYEIWGSIQKTMFGITSTTELKKRHIDAILDVVRKMYGDLGIPVHFPSSWDQYLDTLQFEK